MSDAIETYYRDKVRELDERVKKLEKRSDYIGKSLLRLTSVVHELANRMGKKE